MLSLLKYGLVQWWVENDPATGAKRLNPMPVNLATDEHGLEIKCNCIHAVGLGRLHRMARAAE